VSLFTRAARILGVPAGAAFAAVGVAASVGVHGGLTFAVMSLPKDQKRAATAISMQESKKKPPKPPEPAKLDEKPKPKEKTPQKSPAHAKAAPAEAKNDVPPPSGKQASSAAMDGLPDFGLSLSGGTGSGGLAIPAGGGSGPVADAPAAAAKKAQPQAPKPEGDCAEPVVRPKVTRQVRASYPDAARADKVEGRVRIEAQIDDQGRVTSPRVVSGLGHGLDEAALASVKQWQFSPATRCGKPVAQTITVPIVFQIEK
jgi:protein TonB